MLRTELALIFLFIALIILQRKKITLKSGALVSALMFLVVFTHQLIAVIMFAIIVVTLLRLYYHRQKTEFSKLLACSIPAIIMFLAILYINYFLLPNSVFGFSNNFSSGFTTLASASYSYLAIDTLGFLAFCYLPLVPFLVFSFRHFKNNFQLKTWVFWCIIPLLFVILSPSPLYIGGVLPYRWIMLLVYPLAFYAVEGISRIKWNWYKIGVGILWLLHCLSLIRSKINA
jgi:hypothetical protein